MKPMNLVRLGLVNLLAPALVSFLVLVCLNHRAPVMVVTKESSEVAKAGLEFAKDLQTLALTALGAMGAFLLKLHSEQRLGRRGHQIATLSLGFLCAAIYLGYESQVAALRLWGDTGAVRLDEGPYHWAVSMQVISLVLGAGCYGLLVLCLIQPPSKDE